MVQQNVFFFIKWDHQSLMPLFWLVSEAEDSGLIRLPAIACAVPTCGQLSLEGHSPPMSTHPCGSHTFWHSSDWCLSVLFQLS